MNFIKCNVNGKIVYLDIDKVVDTKDRKISLFKVANPVNKDEVNLINDSNRFSNKEVI